jgi:hypothetical protein
VVGLFVLSSKGVQTTTMYLHTIKPCAYRFTERRDIRGSSQSAALCSCLRWGCYQTTEELSRPLWQKHFDEVNGVVDEDV